MTDSTRKSASGGQEAKRRKTVDWDVISGRCYGDVACDLRLVLGCGNGSQ